MTAQHDRRRPTLGNREAFSQEIDRLIVQVATWGATLFACVLAAVGFATRDAAVLAELLVPASVAVPGWLMVWRRRPRAVIQLLIAMAVTVVMVVAAPERVPGDPTLGLLAMAIAGAVLTRQLVIHFAVAAAAAIGVTAFTWDAAVTPTAERTINSFVAMAAFVITASLLVWLKQRSESNRHQLQSLIESKDQFVATVSHELRTPLTTIVGLAHELEDRFEEFSRDELEEFVAMLVNEGTDVANIVEDLLVAARADIGTLALTCTWLDLIEELASATVEARRIPVDTSSLQTTVSVYADGLRFRQIVRNLIANAVRYGGSDVRVVVGGAGTEVSIEVRDTGAPIPTEDRELIFEPYHRSERSGALPGSAGLGLTVSRRLARLMNGDVTYHHDGNESVFTLRLPASFAEPQFAAAGA